MGPCGRHSPGLKPPKRPRRLSLPRLPPAVSLTCAPSATTFARPTPEPKQPPPTFTHSLQTCASPLRPESTAVLPYFSATSSSNQPPPSGSGAPEHHRHRHPPDSRHPPRRPPRFAAVQLGLPPDDQSILDSHRLTDTAKPIDSCGSIFVHDFRESPDSCYLISSHRRLPRQVTKAATVFFLAAFPVSIEPRHGSIATKRQTLD